MGGRKKLFGLVVAAWAVVMMLGGTPAPEAASAQAPESELLALRAVGGRRPAFVDSAGRQVLLRGVNLNALGDYFQANPDFPAVEPITETDWAEMAAQGFTAIRLIVSWSSLQPERGVLDEATIDRIRAAVDAANAHGMYVVLDMHQDAWGKYIATPEGTVCPPDLEPAIGWDGAPEWATITDGGSTCRFPGARELSDAVFNAFRNFYDDRDGMQREFIRTWQRLAAEFATDPGVAGYDLFNEPNVVEDLAVLGPKYDAFVTRLVKAIRAAERRAGGFSHIAFIEPLVLYPIPGTVPVDSLANLGNVAFAPHNYSESISNFLTIEQWNDLTTAYRDEYGVPIWVGEYGWWDTSDATLAKLARYAAAEDAHVLSGAWWQWRQACGDPHSIGRFGGFPGDQIQYRTMRCPSRVDDGVTPEFARVLTRPYPQAAPGRVLQLAADVAAERFRLAGRRGAADPDAELVVWIPAAWGDGEAAPDVAGRGLRGLRIDPVDGGWLATATVADRYTMRIG